MATPVIISLLVGLVAGGAFMAMWAANRIEEEGVRQFDRGFERGRWLTDISVARAIEDQERTRRVGLLVAGTRQPSGPPARSGAPPVAAGPPLGPAPARVSTRSPSTADPQSAAAGGTVPADLVAIATLMVLATLAPVTAWRRRLATRRFDAGYERNLLRRTGRG
jgi:hypothetical protein